VIRTANQGVQAARNAGVAAATAEFVTMADSDDLFQPDYVAKACECLAALPGTDVMFCNFVNFSERGETADKLSFAPPGFLAGALRHGDFIHGVNDWYARMLDFQPLFPTGMMIRRSLYNGIGGAMVLENIRVGGVALDWQIMGSDISSRVLTTARRGLYPMDRATQLPQPLLKKYCRRGTGPQAGYLLVERSLREKVEFRSINLVENLPELPSFDMIFLRNVMIYFDNPTKAAVVTRLLTRLKPGGTLCVGLAETLNGIVPGLVSAGPGAYRKAGS
jgi:glycosyltransferase involved in cell wall biosynthesis